MTNDKLSTSIGICLGFGLFIVLVALTLLGRW